jgi:hypothetical protein
MDEQRLSQFGEGANTKRCFGCAEGKPADEISFTRRCSTDSKLIL